MWGNLFILPHAVQYSPNRSAPRGAKYKYMLHVVHNMSAEVAQTEIDCLGIEEGDVIRSGPANVWTVEEIRNSRYVDCNLVVQSHEGDWSNMDPNQVSLCQCGQYTIGDAPCYSCHKQGGAKADDQMGATQVLTEAEEREVAWRCVFIGQSQREVGDVFDVSQSTISRVMKWYREVNTGELEKELIDEFDGVVEPYQE